MSIWDLKEELCPICKQSKIFITKSIDSSHFLVECNLCAFSEVRDFTSLLKLQLQVNLPSLPPL